MLQRGCIELNQLSDEHSHRPSVKNNVVDCTEQNMFTLCQSQDLHSPQRTMGQVKWFAHIACGKTSGLHFPLRGPKIAQIHFKNRRHLRLQYHRIRHSVRAWEDSSQCLMPTHNLPQTFSE